ncbi:MULTISPECIES: hypothetical protein [unclassified Brevundimonas]|uniref:hypothetical protein n=1 Tax=unclassified Brevundimonas TaxID=2622653 RepID=UPI0025B9ABA7|nr:MULTISPECIES: hypothetical protein [unclassified Brevundimonas]
MQDIAEGLSFPRVEVVATGQLFDQGVDQDDLLAVSRSTSVIIPRQRARSAMKARHQRLALRDASICLP